MFCSDKKTMRIMEDEVPMMMGEKTASHLYKLRGSIVAVGVMETSAAGVAGVFHGGGESAVDSSDSSH
jgi:hypothetical protein